MNYSQFRVSCSHVMSCMCMHVHAVPTPGVSLTTVSPAPYYAGSVGDITLTCSTSVDMNVVDNSPTLLYAFTWLDSAGVEIVSGGRISITQTSPTSPSSSLTLSPLNIRDTNFTCIVAVTASLNVLDPSDLGSSSISLDVQGINLILKYVL